MMNDPIPADFLSPADFIPMLLALDCSRSDLKETVVQAVCVDVALGRVPEGRGMRDVSDMGYFRLGNESAIGYFAGVGESMFWVGILADHLR